MTVEIPEAFIDRYIPLVDDEAAFLASIVAPRRRSFRVNPLKGSPQNVVDRLTRSGIEPQPVPWYDHAFTTEVDSLSGGIERFIGSIYLQELASMLPPLVVREELARASTVLDACAAPGSKATQTAALMANRGCLVANDRSYSRIRALKFNMNKAGVINTLITNFELHLLPPMEFDVVMLDAPCSSDGTVRKSPNLFKSWLVKRSQGYGERQKDLIVRAFDRLKPGGTLVYSTCSLAPEENELVVDYLLRNRPAVMQPIDLPGFRFGSTVQSWGQHEIHPEVAAAGRVWPHHNDTDGFFVAKVTR